MMNEPEVVTQLLEQLDEQKALADRYRTALQDIKEFKDVDSPYAYINPADDFDKVIELACDALKEGEEPIVKANHDGHLYSFGETTIEVDWIGDPGKPPFKRIKEGE